jgi:hypothetical protein
VPLMARDAEVRHFVRTAWQCIANFAVKLLFFASLPLARFSVSSLLLTP